MGVNKKFLLLAVIILGMQTESYGVFYPKPQKDEQGNIKDDIIVKQSDLKNHLSGSPIITVNKSGSENKNVIIGNGEKNTDDIKINLDKNSAIKKVININKDYVGKVTNKGELSVENGAEIISIQNGKFTNEGVISSGGTGTGLNITGIVSAENTGTINVKDSATGIKISRTEAGFVNKENGKIIVTGGTGILQTAGTVENKGEIKVSKGTGILQKGGTVNTTGTILAIGGTGIIIEGGTTNNGGNIEASNGKSGISLNGTGTFNNSFTDSEGKIQAGIIKVSGVNSKGIHFEVNGGTANNTGTIEVSNGALGAYFNSTKEANFNNLGEIKVSGAIVNTVYTGNEPSKRNIVSSKGVMLNSKGIFTNGEIISKDTGKEISNIIVTDGAVGVHVNNKEAIFNNLGIVNVSGIKELGDVDKNCDGKIDKVEKDQKATSNGILLNTGTTNNGGKIVVSNQGTGIYLNGTGTFNNSFTDSEGKIQAGIIKVSGTNSKGIHFGAKDGEIANNAGTIEVTSGGIGAYFGGNGTYNNQKGSNIIVSGKVVEQVFKEDGTPDLDENGNPKYKTTVSKGIFLNSKGTATNEGNIFVGYKVDDTGNIALGEEGAVGVQVNDLNAKFTNNKDGNIKVAEGSQGIQINKGTAINEGNILTEGTNAVGIYMNAASKKDENGNILYEKSEFTNNNQIVASGTGAKGIQFGAGGGTVTNTGDITAENGAIGVFFYQGTNNILINSGTINAGENGSTIESGKDTNNAVILQKGSKITGKIKGNNGIDVLALDGGTHSKLNVSDYEKIVAKSGDSKIENSTISLGFKEGTDNYISENIGKAEGNVTIADSKLIIDLANKTENSTGLISGQTILAGNIKLAFNGAKGQKEFNVNEILNKDIDFSKANFGSSAMWDYTIENGNVIAKKHSYTEAVGKSQLEDFGKALEQSENGKIEDGDFKTGLTLLGLLDASQFTDAMTQLSGGVHGYTVDFAAINSRTLSNAIKNRELNKERLRDKALNSYDQEVAYINNHHKLGGLMNVDYNEDGVLGITEKQIMPNGKLGLVYGGAKGKAKFENGKHGKANMDNLYLGGYYAYDFTDKLTLVSNANFVYSHTNVTRNIKFSKEGEELKLEQTYDSTYPVFGFGGGATLYYTPYDSSNNSVTLYGGIDWTKIVQGNINEDPDNVENKTNVTIKNIPVDEQMYDSVVPHIGLSLSNNGYIFNRKYRLGVNVDYETELGNIKNGKKLKLSALSTPHRVETTERENVVSYSLNGALDLTEDFTIYGNYTKADSDEYDAERVEAGFKYKMDRMSDLFVTGPLLGNIENSKPYSNRWTGMFSIILDGTEDSNRSYYNNVEKDKNESHSRGDYATSFRMKPKFTLSLNDRETNWSYYFETYYSRNDMFMQLDHNERRSSESRIHGEARWHEQYSKGKYGFNIGYRNETSSSPIFSQYLEADRQKRGTHQFRLTPNFTYNLGNGFVFGGQTTGIIAYEYEGYRKGQTDFEIENEYGITYNGLIPKLRLTVNYFREDTWYDNDFTKKARLNPEPGVYVYDIVRGEKRYQSNQLRPRITYFFGNGGRVELSARIPLGNGGWHNSGEDNKKSSEKYETRYGLKYYQPIAPGLTGMIGGEILTTKTKSTSGNNYGKETRDYSIRPAIGISYNF